MGYLPLIIALSGVLFLWFSVVRESLRKRLNRLNEASEKVQGLQTKIGLKITEVIDNQKNTIPDSDQLTDWLISKEEFSAGRNLEKRLLKAAERLAKDSRILAEKTGGETAEKLREIATESEVLSQSCAEYLLARKDYNYSVQMPTARFFARMSGFKNA